MAQKRAIKHIAAHYKKFFVLTRTREAEAIVVHIAARSESANSFFNRAAALQVAVDVGAVSVVGEVPPLVGDDEGENDSREVEI